MRISSFARGAAAVASAAMISAVIAPAASDARIPGANETGTVVITDSDLMTVTINSNTNGRVTGALTNRSGVTMRCSAPGVGGSRLPNQVTDARIVVAAIDHYSTNIFQAPGLEVPVIGAVGVGSLYDILPTGSLGGSLGTSTSGVSDLRDAQEAARVKGHTGTPYTGSSSNNWDISLNGTATTAWAADLGFPSTGVRTEFQSGALFFCEGGGRFYAFAGYENGTAPTDPAPGTGPR